MTDFHKGAALAAENAGTEQRVEGGVAQHRSYEVRGAPVSSGQQCLSCTCCLRGGCCSQAPAQIVITQDGMVQRVNLIIHARGCCSTTSSGLADTLPPELLQSVSADELQPWMRELTRIGALRTTTCGQVLESLLLICLPCFCGYAIGVWTKEILAWNAALVDWQTRMNHELMQRKGLFVKTRSHCHIWYDKNGKHRDVQRWLAVAMTPEEVQRLQVEPHLTGDVEGPNCCGSPDERLFCLHP